MGRRSLLAVAASAAALTAIAVGAPAAGAACEVPLPGDTVADEETACGPVNPPPDPPPGPSGESPKLLILWTSGFDINPLNGTNRSGIWISRIDGTQRRRLSAFERVNRDFAPHGLNLPDDHPSFSPDNRKIVFTSNRASRANWDIYTMNVNGSGVTRLTTHAGLDTEPVYSPDGTRIAFASEIFGELEIVTMRTDGTDIRRVTNGVGEAIEPAWRPDGQEIAFSRVSSRFQKDVFVIKPDGTGERQVTFTDKEDHDPTYNPTGDQLVITSERPPTSLPYGNVHKIRVSDGASLGDLTSDVLFGAGDPFWSRDGTQIAYFKSTGPEVHFPQRLFVMGPDGSGKFHVPGEALANIHPALGRTTDVNANGIFDYLESGTVGKGDFGPKRLRAESRERLRFTWKHPRRWRSMDTMWLRISSGRWLLGMVRFSIRNQSFSLFDGLRDRYTNARRLGDGTLRSSLLSLDLDETKVVGVSRRKLKLLLSVRFRERIKGHGFRIGDRRLRVRAQANLRKGPNQEEELGRLTILPGD